MADLIERLVADELWTLFRRVVPPTQVIRPQGGGRRRAGDREALAAIIFVATTGCTWRATAAGVRPELADGLPQVRPVEPGQSLGEAPPCAPRRTRSARRAGL